jgi:hypothetical protein
MNQDPFFQSREWLELRYRALDASKGVCGCCGQRGGAGNPLQVDHVKPRSKHPELALTPTNLQVLCRNCNMGKSNKSDTDWRFVPSTPMEIQNSVAPETRFRLQQLNWLALNGDSKQIRKASHVEYRKLQREAEMAFLKDKKR